MEYVSLTNDEILASLTYDPSKLVEPILDELQYYNKYSEEVEVTWADVKMDFADGRVSFEGYPLHPFVAWRLSDYIMPISRTKMVLFEDHPALWEEFFRAGIGKLGETSTLVINNGEISAVNSLGIPFYQHVDYIEPMLDSVVRSLKVRKIPCALSGFMVSPVWSVVRLLPVTGKLRHNYVGFQMEANYLFRKGMNRASIAPYVRDFKLESEMDLYNLWSVSAPGFVQSATNQLKSFNRKFTKAKAATSLATTMERVERQVRQLDEEEALREWRQALLVRVQSHGVSGKTLRNTIVDFHRGSKLSYAMTLLRATKTYQLDRQMIIERSVTKMLKGEM